jgi:hypothetical protein
MNRDGTLDPLDNVDGNHDDDSEDRIIGVYIGTGLGSVPMFGNTGADRRVAYINRIDTAAQATRDCPDAPDSGIDDDMDTVDPADDPPNDSDTPDTDPPALLPVPTTFPGTGDACGIGGCLPQLRENLGRTAWKELRGD